MAARNYNNTSPTALTSSFIDATTTAVALDKAAGFPAPPFTAAIGRGTQYEEIVLVTAINALTATITRGYDGSVAQSHAVSSTVEHVAVARDFAEANGHVNAAAGVHGVAGALVGLTDTQTLTNKTLTAPSLSSPTITGTASLATANVTTLSVSGVTTLASLTTSGAVTLASLSVTGATALTGLLTANGGITVPAGKKVTLTDAPATGTDAGNKTYIDGRTTIATWTTLTIGGGFLANAAPAVTKDVQGWAALRGAVANQVTFSAPSAVMFTLPTGFRPGITARFPITINNPPYVAVLTIIGGTGVATVDFFTGSVAANSIWNLDAVHFRAEA